MLIDGHKGSSRFFFVGTYLRSFSGHFFPFSKLVYVVVVVHDDKSSVNAITCKRWAVLTIEGLMKLPIL